MAEGANIAGWVFRNNRLESADGRIYLDGKNGIVRLNGILQLSSATSGDFEDANIFHLPAVTTVKSISLEADVKHIGKVIRMYNSGAAGTNANYKVYCHTFGADYDGFMSWESMSGYNAIIRPEEWAEFTCIKTEETSSGCDAAWELSNRFSQQDFINDGGEGRFPLVLAMGTLNGAAKQADCYLSGYWYNGKALSAMMNITRSGEGYYTLTMKSGSLPSGYMVFATGIGTNEMKPTVQVNSTSSFVIYISDDASRNDGSCYFMIMSSNWWYKLY